MKKTVVLQGQEQIIEAARCMIEHQSTFALRSLYDHKANDENALFRYELTIDDDEVPETAYDMALVKSVYPRR